MNRNTLRGIGAAALALLLALPLNAAAAKAKAKPKPKKTPVASAPAAPAAPVALKASPASGLKILGDSTLHKWVAVASKLEITGEAVPKPGSLLEQVKAGTLSRLKVSVPVEGLKSDESAKMDKNMYAAMESDKFGEVAFSLKGYQVLGDEVTAQGSLTIHGVSKDIELKGKLSAKDGGVAVKGSYELKMSDYGIKPPVMMLGTVKVADKVAIAYDYDLLPQAPAVAAKP